ncbi:MAG: hypothetical protein APF82_02400 [Sphingomonadales bacterium BRH_c42]|nr:MAG: hypothetical protein APF82_02400 [Sphingomonadales bacterium BRH_c42]
MISVIVCLSFEVYCLIAHSLFGSDRTDFFQNPLPRFFLLLKLINKCSGFVLNRLGGSASLLFKSGEVL